MSREQDRTNNGGHSSHYGLYLRSKAGVDWNEWGLKSSREHRGVLWAKKGQARQKKFCGVRRWWQQGRILAVAKMKHFLKKIKKVQKHKEKLFAFFFRVYNNYCSCILFCLIKIFHYTKIQQKTTLLKYWMHLIYKLKYWVFFSFQRCACMLSSVPLTLCDPMDCSPPGSSVHGILQARILEWVAISFSRG